ncbi:MAG: hypothetical protein ACP5NE_02195 [Candidatus Micrarchaeia archaeon]
MNTLTRSDPKTESKEIRNEINRLSIGFGNYPVSNEHLYLDNFANEEKVKEFDALVLICGGATESLRLVHLFGEKAKHIYIVDKDADSIGRFKLLLRIMEENPAYSKADFEYYTKVTKADKSNSMFYRSVIDEMRVSGDIAEKIKYIQEDINDAISELTDYSEKRRYFFYLSNILGSGWSEKLLDTISSKIVNNENVVKGSEVLLVGNNDKEFMILEKKSTQSIKKRVFSNSPYEKFLRNQSE